MVPVSLPDANHFVNDMLSHSHTSAHVLVLVMLSGLRIATRQRVQAFDSDPYIRDVLVHDMESQHCQFNDGL